MSNDDSAQYILEKASQHLSEAPSQSFVTSPGLLSTKSSPHETLSFELTRALLVIGLRFNKSRSVVLQCISRYLSNTGSIANSESSTLVGHGESTDLDGSRKSEIATVALSLLGFLEAVAGYCDFYRARERLDLLRHVRAILSENFMVAVEGVFSSIRTSGSTSKNLAQWRVYVKNYAANGRPLGAMLLQNQLMRLVVSTSSLQVCAPPTLRQTDVFGTLLSDKKTSFYEKHKANISLLDLQSEIATECVHLLEDGSDYLQLGSAWQQRLAFLTKSYSIQTYLSCMVLDEESADPETLMSWLEDAMTDPVQMADDALASTVLQAVAVIAKFSPSFASALSRSLPRFIVQSGLKSDVAVMAARSLSYVLRSLSQDAVITGLYSLGNVLSAGSNTERSTVTADVSNGTIHPRHTGQYNHQSTGSAISLDLSGEEETAAAYGNVVRAIVTIANCCEDDKITALAQTMLLQRLGRINMAVDTCIIAEAARLALSGGPTEFKTLLKLYARLAHEGVIQGNSILLASACTLTKINLISANTLL